MGDDADERLRRMVIRALRMTLEALEGAGVSAAATASVNTPQQQQQPLPLSPAPGTPSPGTPSPTLRPKERKLLTVATTTPQTGKVLAKLAGLSANADTRDALANLQRLGALVRGPEGYRLP